MLFSIALIFICGLALAEIFQKLHLPRLLGMLITGILLGPYVLNLLDESLLNISADIRQFALIIILSRAGLNLDINDLKKNGLATVFMCFVPACCEILGMVVLAPKLLHISLVEAAVLGSVIAAVSPAVVVPKMLYLIENKYGTKKGIPQMIMACASVDDVFVIVLFSVFTSLAQGGSVSALSFLQIPISIVLGAAIGVVFGFVLSVFFTKAKTRSTINVIIILCTAFVLVTLESILKGKIPFSALLAVMALGITVRKKVPDTAEKLSSKFSKIWVGAEVMLFALVGAATDVKYAVASGGVVVIVLLGALCFRAIGVVLCTIKTNLNMKERIFCVLAYLPKATVQAAIGSMPLAMGLACGKIVLTGAVLAILITAPLGALGIDLSYKKLLIK